MSFVEGYQIRPTIRSDKSKQSFAWGSTATLPALPEPEPQAPIDPIFGEGTTLNFKHKSIRVLPVNGVPWFALPDLADALGLTLQEADKVVNSPDFPAYGRLVADESSEPDPQITTEPGPVTLLSPVAVWWITALTEPFSGQGVAAWARREAASMCPAPALGDPSLFLRVLPGPMLPPYPAKYSGRKSEWIDLRWSNQGLLAKPWTPTSVN